MKRMYLLLAVVVTALVSCTKTKTTTNNYALPPAQPAFAINGIVDKTFTNNFFDLGGMDLTVQYLDSAQENVSLSLSGIPANVVIDTTWLHSGIPTYNTILALYDTAAGGSVPGTYPITITATTSSGKQKAYTFNLRIEPMPTSFLGKYNTCYAYCDSTVTYTDSLYADATVPNKVWFTNYAGSGHAVYGMLTGQGGNIYIPNQTIAGNTYTSNATVTLPHSINVSISTSCALNMF